ncbi:MAG: hypothetical protein IKH01_06810 [Prevotella sp.]|nr:hypothetical protein [Prevotella sp.]
MKRKLNQIVRWVSTKGLIWLGFGATPFIFMACYGPVPTQYNEADFAEEVVDSNAVDSVDVAEEAVEESAEANEEI